MKKNIILIIVLLFIPIVCNATTVTYDNAQIEFEIDETEWTRSDDVPDGSVIYKVWESDCGIIMSGAIDTYGKLSRDEQEQIDRDGYTYWDYLTDNYAKSFVKGYASSMETGDIKWEYYENNMKFVNFYGRTNLDGVIITFDGYVTINNGYSFVIQYLKKNSVHNGVCINTIRDMIKSAEAIYDIDESFDDYENGQHDKKESNEDNEIDENGISAKVIAIIVVTIIVAVSFGCMIFWNEKKKDDNKQTPIRKTARKIKIDDDERR